MAQQPQFKLEQMRSMINSLKEIMTIIVGLALTNSIIQFVTVDGAIREIKDISPESAIIFTLSAITMVRFYHGNFRHLDVVYSYYNYKDDYVYESVKQHPKEEKVALDFFLILIESLILCVMSFYQRIPLYFFYIFIILLIFDIIWFCSIWHVATSEETFKHQKYWTVSNMFTIIALVIVQSLSTSLKEDITIYISSFIILANSLVDYKWNWNFYFPIPSEKEEESE